MNREGGISTLCEMWPRQSPPQRSLKMFMTQIYFRVDGSTFGPAVDAGEAERSTGMRGGKGDGTRVGNRMGMVGGVGTSMGMVDGVGTSMGMVAVTGALTGRVALTGGWGLLAAVSLAAVSL